MMEEEASFVFPRDGSSWPPASPVVWRRWGEGDVSGEDNRLSCRLRVSVCCLVSNDQTLKRQIKQKEAITSTAHLSKTWQREKLIISTPAEI